jgi:hypothetical protein
MVKYNFLFHHPPPPPPRHNALGFFGWGRRSLKIHTEILKIEKPLTLHWPIFYIEGKVWKN